MITGGTPDADDVASVSTALLAAAPATATVTARRWRKWPARVTGVRSAVGALGIAQFMPATAALYDLRDPLDPASAIDAQARLMRDLLRRFGAVPLALAAYNAGPGAVAACMCVPPFGETQIYVARILSLIGAGGGGAATGPLVRLIE